MQGIVLNKVRHVRSAPGQAGRRRLWFAGGASAGDMGQPVAGNLGIHLGLTAARMRGYAMGVLLLVGWLGAATLGASWPVALALAMLVVAWAIWWRWR